MTITVYYPLYSNVIPTALSLCLSKLPLWDQKQLSGLVWSGWSGRLSSLVVIEQAMATAAQQWGKSTITSQDSCNSIKQCLRHHRIVNSKVKLSFCKQALNFTHAHRQNTLRNGTIFVAAIYLATTTQEP